MAAGRKKAGSAKGPGRLARLGRWLRVFALVLVFSGVCGAFGMFLIDSEYLRVRTIRVDGACQLDPQGLVAYSGITNKDNLLLLDVAAVQERLQALSYVRTCDVTRVFPDLVQITIEERYPLATLVVNNRSYLVDREAVVLRELDRGEEAVGPLICSVPDVAAVTEGQPVDAPALHAALEAWQAFATTEMAGEVTVSEIAALHPNDLQMICDELGYRIRWGRGEYEKQAERLDILWSEKDGCLPCREYLDVRFGMNLACK